MTASLPHEIIRASAGSGKTFQLTNRFLQLVLSGAPSDGVFAATFARKAAGEILDRILQRLANAAETDAAAARLADEIGPAALAAAGLTGSADDWRGLLRGLVRRLHRLHIGTLDSFFVQLAGHFSLELGLPPAWRILDDVDDRRLRREAIQELLRTAPRTELQTLLHMLCVGKVQQSVAGEIHKTVSSLYGLYHDAPAAAWQALPAQRELSPDELADAMTLLSELRETDGKPFAKTIDADLARLQQNWYTKFLETGIPGAMLEGKTKFSRKEIPSVIRKAYDELIDHAGSALINRAVHQTAASHRLLGFFHERYFQLKRQQRGLLFDDVTRLLAQAWSSGGLSDPRHRLDSPCDHLLLDEFQDTSVAQWQVLHPLAQRVTSPEAGRSFFCVGDVKQAIYGWRGGVSEIFEAVDQMLPGLTARRLDVSYRSSPPIIDAVNRVFAALPTAPCLADWPEVARNWQLRFAPHETRKTGLRGFVRVQVGPEGTEKVTPAEAAHRFAAERIAEWHRDHPGRSIGVLVRTNKAVARLIFLLKTRHNVLASEEGGNPLTDSMCVQVILSLLHLADHPGDRVARYHVARSPLGPLVGYTDFHDNPAAWKLARRIREQLLADGYGRTLYGWVRGLAPQCDERELRRLHQLVELGYASGAAVTLRPSRFVEQVRTQKVEDPATAAVRVMTIHQAKGLEFDIVVLPDLDNRLAPMVPSAVVGRETPIAPPARVLRYLAKAAWDFCPAPWPATFKEFPLPAVNEAICLLYVGLTRAVHVLDVVVPPTTRKGQTAAKLVCETLAPGVETEPGRILYTHGQPDWDAPRVEPNAIGVARPESAKGVTESTTPSLTAAGEPIRLRGASNRARGLEHASPSGLEGGPRVDLGRILRIDNRIGLARGTLFHAWFEQVRWLDAGEPVPSDPQLTRLGKQTCPGVPFNWPAETAAFRDMLAAPGLRAALSEQTYRRAAAQLVPPAAAGSLRFEVWRERPFAVKQAAPILAPREQAADDLQPEIHAARIMQGFIDRVVITLADGRPVAAEVLDFKTDNVSAKGALNNAIATYTPQLAAYRQAVAAMTGLPLERVSAKLLFVGPGLVYDLPAAIHPVEAATTSRSGTSRAP